MDGRILIYKGCTPAQLNKFLKANPDAIKQQGLSMLEQAIEKERFDLLETLIKAGVELNVSVDWKSPLKVAVRTKSQPLVLWLLKNGADVNFKLDAYDPTALHDAISDNSLPMVKLLLKHGADPELLGQNPLKNALAAAQFWSCTEIEAYLKSCGFKKSVLVDSLKKVDIESTKFKNEAFKNPQRWFEKKWPVVLAHVETRGVKKLSEQNRILFVVGYLIDQLAGEGAHGVYSNPSGAYAAEMPAALRKIGATDFADRVQKINACFPKGAPSTRDETRSAQIQKLPAETEELFLDLEKLFKKSKPLLQKLYDYYHSK